MEENMESPFEKEREAKYQNSLRNCETAISFNEKFASSGSYHKEIYENFKSGIETLESIGNYKDSLEKIKEFKERFSITNIKLKKRRKVKYSILGGALACILLGIVILITYYYIPKGCDFVDETNTFYVESSARGNVKVPSYVHYRKVKNVQYDYSDVSKIRIPKTCTSVRYTYCDSIYYADFSDYTNLTSIHFSECENLNAVILPKTLTEIEESSFSYCPSLSHVEIPDSLVKIGSWAFYNDTSLTEIEFPSGLKAIENHAFYNCKGLKKLEFPSSLEEIGDCAFSGCKGIRNVAFNKELKSIGEWAFQDCPLSQIEIPDSVTEIGSDAFTFNKESLYTVKDNGIYIGNTDNPYLWIVGTKDYTISSLTIDDNCKHIAGGAFAGSNLSSVTIPDGVVSIGDYAFMNCMLEDITLPSSVTEIGASSFSGCYNLISVSLPDSLKKIGKAAFYNCVLLKDIKLPDSLTEIGEYALSYCDSLESLTIPKNLQDIPYYLLDNTSLKELKVDPSNEKYTSLDSNAVFEKETNTLVLGIETSLIPEGVEKIGDYAFYNCKGLTKLCFPSSLKEIGVSAFENCDGITEVTLPSSLERVGDCAFALSDSISSLHATSSGLIIGKSAFASCESLTTVLLEGTEEIGAFAFYNCVNLENITVDSSLKRMYSTMIGYYSTYLHDYAEETVYYPGTKREFHKNVDVIYDFFISDITILCSDGSIYYMKDYEYVR